MSKFKSGDKVELNCSVLDFCKEVAAGGKIYDNCFINGIATIHKLHDDNIGFWLNRLDISKHGANVIRGEEVRFIKKICKEKPFLQTGEEFEHTKTLNFILERVINVHGEHESVDYIHKLRNAIIFTEKMESPKQKIELPKPIKPRTKVEYVKVEDSIFHLQPDLVAGELYSRNADGEYEQIIGEYALTYHCATGRIYRKVETEITQQDAFQEFIFDNKIGLDIVCDSISKTNNYGELEIKQGEKSYNINGITEEMLLKMCHLVESMTDKPE